MEQAFPYRFGSRSRNTGRGKRRRDLGHDVARLGARRARFCIAFRPISGGAGGYFRLDRQSAAARRSEEHTSELQSLMRISYAVFCLKKNITYTKSNVLSYNKNTINNSDRNKSEK